MALPPPCPSEGMQDRNKELVQRVKQIIASDVGSDAAAAKSRFDVFRNESSRFRKGEVDASVYVDAMMSMWIPHPLLVSPCRPVCTHDECRSRVRPML